jgi:pSer/pThr/pTyr-binding forkhead associated (FHA) protein
MNIYKLKGTSGSVINQSFPFGDSIVLGSSASCDVQLDEAGVASRHAEICLINGRSLMLKDLGSETGTRVNGEPVIETMLASGDEIHIGTCRWMLQAPGLRPERILTADVVGKPARRWPRALGWGILVSTAVALAVIKWKPEWLEFLRAFTN